MLTLAPHPSERGSGHITEPLYNVPNDSPVPAAERRWLLALSVGTLLLKALAFFQYRFDSDEAQHLHVTWGWTASLIQYRDVFDNHAPLFHMLTAPLLALVGERANVLLYMRSFMVPLFACVVLATWLIGERLFSRRVAAWGTLLLVSFPAYFLKSLEYRTDNLWMALWMCALVVLVGRPFTIPRAFWSGLLFGTAFAVSLKTPLLIVTLFIASFQTDLLLGRLNSWRKIGRKTLAAAAGFVIVPGVLLLLFHHWGALDALYYCNVTFNLLAPSAWQHPTLLKLLYPIELWVIHEISRRRLRNRSEADRQPLFLFLVCGVFVATLVSFWPLISTRDFLPIIPILALLTVRWITDSGPTAIELAAPRNVLYLLVALTVIQSGAVCADGALWKNQTRTEIAEIHQVLTLTRPGEPVMDVKGETIFRPRPFYYIFEFISRKQFRNGLLADRIPESVVAARCHVAQADAYFFPPRGREFLRENFLDVGRLRVAGQFLGPGGVFNIAVPGDYLVVGSGGPVSGELDGKKTSGPRYLAAGPHGFRRDTVERMACVWAPAIQRGFSPFHLRDIVR
jgi:hypothetical protein